MIVFEKNIAQSENSACVAESWIPPCILMHWRKGLSIFWDTVMTLAMDALPWIGGASGAVFFLSGLLKIVVRPIRKEAKAAAKELKALVESATIEIKSETAAKIGGAVKANEAKVDGAVNEIKAHVDGVENARKAKAEGEEKVQDAQITHLKSVVEENRRDIRNLESFVYRDGKSFDGGGNEPSPPTAE